MIVKENLDVTSPLYPDLRTCIKHQLDLALIILSGHGLI